MVVQSQFNSFSGTPTPDEHVGVRCDGCSGPIRGIRHKCSFCPDYDLCTQCKQNGIHNHHMMHEVNPPQSPAQHPPPPTQHPPPPTQYPHTPAQYPAYPETPSQYPAYPQNPQTTTQYPQYPQTPTQYPQYPQTPTQYPQYPQTPTQYPQYPQTPTQYPQYPQTPTQYPQYPETPTQYPQYPQTPGQYPHPNKSPQSNSTQDSQPSQNIQQSQCSQPPQTVSGPVQTFSQPPQTGSQPVQTSSQPVQSSQPPQTGSQPVQTYPQPVQSSQPPQTGSQPVQTSSQPIQASPVPQLSVSSQSIHHPQGVLPPFPHHQQRHKVRHRHQPRSPFPPGHQSPGPPFFPGHHPPGPPFHPGHHPPGPPIQTGHHPAGPPFPSIDINQVQSLLQQLVLNSGVQSLSAQTIGTTTTTQTSGCSSLPIHIGSSSSPASSSSSNDLTTARWNPPEAGIPSKRHRLQNADPEYQTVIQNMANNGGSDWTSKVLEISRIENYSLFNVYESCKAEMKREYGPGFQNERILWHGTHADVLGNIYRGGFNRSYCGRNATAFGDGVYFATSFSYSASSTYSPPDAKAQKYIFQCRVLTGHFTQGNQGLKEPPMRTNELRYDSVVDKMANPKMFVIFKDMQVYPEYVITLKV